MMKLEDDDWGLCIVGILAGSTSSMDSMKGFPEDVAQT